MKEKIIEFSNLSDSREMLEAKTPNFISFFILLILAIFLVAFIWMWAGEIDIIVKSTGIVRPGQTVSTVYSSQGGIIEEINYYPGKKVNKGEKLFTVDISSLETKRDNIINWIEETKQEKSNLKKLEESIEREENLFSNNLTEERLLYYNRYQTYHNKIRQLELEQKQAERNYNQKKILSDSAVSESQLKELHSDLEYAEISLEQYQTEKLINIEEEINRKKRELEELKENKEEIEDQIDLSQKKAPISGKVQPFQEFNT
ncbi:MAG: hypothetical protein ACOCRB_02650, partial [Halanaerobiaceae bacterium]